jgi:hypothetical protein
MGYRLPFFPLYAAETLADGRFQGWNLEERGAWLTLVCCCWNDGDIPAAQSTLARLLGVGPGDMARLWSAIGDRFIEAPGKPGRLISPRLETERDKAEGLSKIRAEAGTKGAKARWDSEKPAHGKRIAKPSQTHGKANAVAMANDAIDSHPTITPTTTTIGQTDSLWLAGIAKRVAEALGQAKVSVGRNPGTVEASIRRIVALAGEDAAVLAMAHIVKTELGGQVSSLAALPGWIDRIPDAEWVRVGAK